MPTPRPYRNHASTSALRGFDDSKGPEERNSDRAAGAFTSMLLTALRRKPSSDAVLGYLPYSASIRFTAERVRRRTTHAAIMVPGGSGPVFFAGPGRADPDFITHLDSEQKSYVVDSVLLPPTRTQC